MLSKNWWPKPRFKVQTNLKNSLTWCWALGPLGQLYRLVAPALSSNKILGWENCLRGIEHAQPEDRLGPQSWAEICEFGRHHGKACLAQALSPVSNSTAGSCLQKVNGWACENVWWVTTWHQLLQPARGAGVCKTHSSNNLALPLPHFFF